MAARGSWQGRWRGGSSGRRRRRALDPGGAGLHCILEIAPDVLDVAASLDAALLGDGDLSGPRIGVVRDEGYVG